MGVVVSAIATGLVHNIGADCVNNKEKITDTDNKDQEEGVKVTKIGDSPQRIQTPGFPTVTLLPAPSSSPVLNTANVTKEYSKSEPPPPPPPSRLYPPSPTRSAPTAPVPAVINKQTLNTSSAPENNSENKSVEKIIETIRRDIIDSDISNNNTKSIDYENDKQENEVNANHHQQSNSNDNNSLDQNVFSISPVFFAKSGSETVNYPETTLPIVSLLPTLTEEISLTLAQSQAWVYIFLEKSLSRKNFQ